MLVLKSPITSVFVTLISLLVLFNSGLYDLLKNVSNLLSMPAILRK